MPDLAVANENAGTVSVYRNTSGNWLLTFDPKVDVTTGVHPKSGHPAIWTATANRIWQWQTPVRPPFRYSKTPEIPA